MSVPVCPFSPVALHDLLCGRCSTLSLGLYLTNVAVSDLFLLKLCPNGNIKIRINREVSRQFPSPPFSAPISSQHRSGQRGVGFGAGRGRRGLCACPAPVMGSRGRVLGGGVNPHKSPMKGPTVAAIASTRTVWLDSAGLTAKVWDSRSLWQWPHWDVFCSLGWHVPVKSREWPQ